MKGGIVHALRSFDPLSAPPSPPAPAGSAIPGGDLAEATSLPMETLLAAILADHRPGTLCAVQFVACGARASARATALAFAAASAAQFGRTLALETDAAAPLPAPTEWTMHAPCSTEQALHHPAPDTAIRGLSHARIEAGGALAVRKILSEWAELQHRPFAMVVLDSAAPAAGAQALTLARSCTATVLVAEAGSSPLAALRDTQRRLAASRAILAGFVFVRGEAAPPRIRPVRR